MPACFVRGGQPCDWHALSLLGAAQHLAAFAAAMIVAGALESSGGGVA